MSVAGWKGFLQLFTKPFYWEKTEHGLVDAHDYLDDAAVTVPSCRPRRRPSRSRRSPRGPGPWCGRDRRSGIDRRKGERRLGFGSRAGR